MLSYFFGVFMNNLLIDKRTALKFLRENCGKKHIPSLTFMYESHGNFVGIFIKNNVVNRKLFKEEEDCINWLESKYTYKLTESSKSFPRLREWMTITDLMSVNNVSDETKHHGRIRYDLYRGENVNAKLKNCIYDPNNDTLTFSFITTATMKAHEPGYKPYLVDPLHNFQTVANPNDTYTMMIQIVDFMMWLKDTRPDNLGKITWREIKDVLDVAYIKIWCNCKSFHWFGKNYRASQKDASVYPTSIPDRKTRGRFGADDILCKHLANLMKPQAIKFFLPQMASKTQKTLRYWGLI